MPFKVRRSRKTRSRKTRTNRRRVSRRRVAHRSRYTSSIRVVRKTPELYIAADPANPGVANIISSAGPTATNALPLSYYNSTQTGGAPALTLTGVKSGYGNISGAPSYMIGSCMAFDPATDLLDANFLQNWSRYRLSGVKIKITLLAPNVVTTGSAMGTFTQSSVLPTLYYRFEPDLSKVLPPGGATISLDALKQQNGTKYRVFKTNQSSISLYFRPRLNYPSSVGASAGTQTIHAPNVVQKGQPYVSIQESGAGAATTPFYSGLIWGISDAFLPGNTAMTNQAFKWEMFYYFTLKDLLA